MDDNPAIDPAEELSAGGEAMSDDELVSLLGAHEIQSIGYFDSEIANEQAQAIEYYYGRMDDLQAQEGCSSVVDHSVQVQVDNGLASILKPFVSSDEVVRFDPRGPEDEAQASQATEYVNYVINCDNAGFLIFHNWFKDALLTKLGVVKVWWEDKTTHEQREAIVDPLGLLEAREGDTYQGEKDNGDGTFTVSQLQANPDGKVTIENVPPEEFLISPFARSIETAPYVAHRPTNFTRSDLIEMGVDAEIVAGLPAYAPGNADETRSRARYRDEQYGSQRMGETGDPSRDVIGVLDEYVRVDYNGDGIAELRRVVRVDDQILLNEEIEEAPFALLCPVPMPHKVYGRSFADLSIEGQRIGTALKRQTLDNLYKSNNPRPIVSEQGMGLSTMEDIADTAPGAAIRVKAQGAIDFMTVPFTAQHSMPMMEMVQRETEERTGIQRKGNGLNPETLEKNSPDTATQASIDENSRNERAEMVARIFAETGVTRLFKLVLKLLVNHQPKERLIRLRNEWVPVDPRGWSPDMDLTISVGLGVGNRSEQIMQADSVLQTMANLQTTPYAYLIDASKVYNALKRKFAATGIKNVDDFLVDPAKAQPPQQQPSPEAQKAQAEMQLKAQDQQFKQQEASAKLQAMQAENAARLQLMREEAGAQLELARQKAAAEMQIAREKMAAEMQLSREQQAMNAALQSEADNMRHERESRSMEMESEDAISEDRAGGALDE